MHLVVFRDDTPAYAQLEVPRMDTCVAAIAGACRGGPPRQRPGTPRGGA